MKEKCCEKTSFSEKLAPQDAHVTLSDLGSFLSGVGLLSQERDREIVSSAGGGRYMGVNPKIGGVFPQNGW